MVYGCPEEVYKGASDPFTAHARFVTLERMAREMPG
jgi:hypothetical protein